jgi:glycosyltransferase involved in cell wall biosynthesis
MTVLIYRHDLLPYTETFVLEQARHLRRYRPFFAGLRRVEGLALPEDRVAVAEEDGRLFRWTGRWRALEGRMRREGVRVVHAHFEGGGIGARRLARRMGAPLVTTCHGWDVTVADESRWPGMAARWMYQRERRRLQEEGALFLAVSEHIRRKMLERGYPAERTVVHRVGVDTEAFRAEKGVQREPMVLFVGRLVEKKGCGDLVEAMGRMGGGARLVLVGDGPLRGELEALAGRVYPRAEFVGARPVEEVRRWMERARVLCVPTVRAGNGDMDGCPIVFYEAAAMGLPVAAYRCGGTPEAVLDGETGRLAAEGDRAGLGEAIGELLEGGAAWERMSAAARERAEREFDVRRQCAVLEEMYDRVAGGA